MSKLTILSALGRPLLAEVDLLSVQKDELATLTARLAPPEAFTQANVQYSPALVGVRLSIERRADGRPYIKIISTRPVNEPLIGLLVELNWAQGRLVREYTALIEPPAYTPGAPIVQAVPPGAVGPAVTLESQPIAPTAPRVAAPAKPAAKAPAVTRPAAVPAKAESKEYGPVKRGDTLAKIAGSGKGAPRRPADSVRMLEEETAAREKALAEANDRITHLEKTIQDLQRLLEIKGQVPGAPAAKPVPQPAPEAKPGATPPVKGDQVAKAEPAKAEPAKAEPAKVEPAKDTGKAPAEAPKDDQKAASAEQRPATTEPLQREAPKAETPKAEPEAQIQPTPKLKPPNFVQAPPDLIDQVLKEPLYLAAGGGLIALLGGWWLARRRRTQVADDEDWRKKAAPQLGKGAAAPPAMVEPALTAPAGDGDDVDPLAEADLYLNFGRDEQAEEVLKEALEKNPKHEEAELKLLQIYAGRKDKAAFEKIARNLHTQTIGAGDNWLKAAAMGYAFDPGHGLYEAGRSAPAAAMPAARGAATLRFSNILVHSAAAMPAARGAATTGNNFDFNRELSQTSSEAAVEVNTGAAGKTTLVPNFAFDIPESMQPPAAADKTLDAPGDETAKANVKDDWAAPKADMIDFEIVAPAPAPAVTGDTAARMTDTVDFYSDAEAPAPASAVTGDTAAPLAPEFNLDDINLNLDDTTKTVVTKAPEAEGGAKDDRWYDVQTKFDLAKAYQEMGDKDGAREVLQQVIKEGNAGQQAEAMKLLDSLG